MPAVATFSTRRSEIAGVPVPDLAASFGTPLYVYDAAKIIERINELRAFDVIRYAQKACSNLAVLDLVRRHGVVVDAVSAGEVRRALAAGYQPQGEPHQIVYTADIFDRESLGLVRELGLHVNCGSPDMLDQLGEVCPGSNVTLRINPGFGHGHSQKTNTGGEQSKHGIWHGEITDCLRRADRHNIVVTGLHMHIGSGTDLEHLRHVCDAMDQCAREVGRTLTTISCGGGLPVPYRADQGYIDLATYFQLWDATRRRLEDAFGKKLSLEIEPGRYLVAESGYLVSEIRAIKQSGQNLFYLLDAGFNNLARPILYGAYHPMSICPAPGRALGQTEHPVVVGGPLCESGDIFTQEDGGFVRSRPLPPAAIGDYLILEVAGAYGAVMGSNYNGKPLAAEVLIHNQVPHLVRARQTFEDLIKGETIPAL
ncbi:MAG: diaminopimelate decarboxylase [Pirellulales bacterium]|nr:diaminopimelate decarboxylase [Pirellulales bacterium]